MVCIKGRNTGYRAAPSRSKASPDRGRARWEKSARRDGFPSLSTIQREPAPVAQPSSATLAIQTGAINALDSFDASASHTVP